MVTKYISSNTSTLIISDSFKIDLLWGDRVLIDFSDVGPDGFVRCKGRGYTGYINPVDLGDESLLELYFIDVGQGDGVLIKCPDPDPNTLGKHILVDGGYQREKQPLNKNASDFVDWKFNRDYDLDTITIDDMIISHCDADHYGGLWDLVNEDPEARDELDCDDVKVGQLYHAGVAWMRMQSGANRSLGREIDGRLKDILTDRTHIESLLDKTQYPNIQGEYGDFLKAFTDSQPGVGMDLLGHDVAAANTSYLNGYAPGDSGDVKLEILGPLYHSDSGSIEMNDLGGKSTNTNGNSVVLMLHFKGFRFLLTGDLNKKSQKKLLQAHHPSKFACDVTKACHHGSDDVSLNFMQKVHAAATIISSGDNESHAHPKANILAMSAVTGYREDENDTIKSPLIYSTEIARSIRIGHPTSVKLDMDDGSHVISNDLGDVTVNYNRTNSGDLNPKSKSKTLNKLTLVDGVIFGLVNVRTDGNKILIAVRKEKGHEWDIDILQSRFSPLA